MCREWCGRKQEANAHQAAVSRQHAHNTTEAGPISPTTPFRDLSALGICKSIFLTANADRYGRENLLNGLWSSAGKTTSPVRP